MESFSDLFRFDLEEVSGLAISCAIYEQCSQCEGIRANVPWSINILAFLLVGGSGLIEAMLKSSIFVLVAGGTAFTTG